MIKRKSIYERITADDYNKVIKELERLNNMRISTGSKPAIRNSPNGINIVVGGGRSVAEGIKTGIVVKTIDRGQPIEYGGDGLIISVAVPAVETYGILPNKTVDTWAMGVDYAADALVTLSDGYYKSLIAHTSNEANSPLVSTATWEVYEGIDGVWQVEPETSPLLFMPFLKVGTLVNYSLVENVAQIHGTPIKVQSSTASGARYSLYWDERLGRAKAVFA